MLARSIVRCSSRVEHMNPQLLEVIGIETRKSSQRESKARNGIWVWVPARLLSTKGNGSLYISDESEITPDMPRYPTDTSWM
jgi:hypothetical protein